jgi:hypothetical protein
MCAIADCHWLWAKVSGEELKYSAPVSETQKALASDTFLGTHRPMAEPGPSLDRVIFYWGKKKKKKTKKKRRKKKSTELLTMLDRDA